MCLTLPPTLPVPVQTFFASMEGEFRAHELWRTADGADLEDAIDVRPLLVLLLVAASMPLLLILKLCIGA